MVPALHACRHTRAVADSHTPQEMTVAENSTHRQDAERDDAESVSSKAEEQEQEEQRIQTEARLSMDPTDMADAIDHEKDQKFDGDDETRYGDEVDKALPNDAH